MDEQTLDRAPKVPRLAGPTVLRRTARHASSGTRRDTSDRGWSIRERWPLFLGLLIALAVWCAIDVERRARVLPHRLSRHRTDLTVYTTAGAAFFDGRNPYEVTNPRGWHYLYPPLFAILMAPLDQFAPQWQAVIWFALSVAMGFGCFYECRRIVHHLQRNDDSAPERSPSVPTWIGVAALVAVLLPTLNCLQRGQVGIAVVYLLLLGFRLVLVGVSMRTRLIGGIVLAAPVTLKLTPALPVALVMLGQFVAYLGEGGARRHFARAFAPSVGVLLGMLLFVLVIPAAFVGWRANVAHLQTWMERVVINDDVGRDNDFNLLSIRNQSLQNAIYRLGNWVGYVIGEAPDDKLVDEEAYAWEVFPMDAPAVNVSVNLARMSLVLLLLASVVVAAYRDGPLDQAAYFGLGCAATLPISPLSWAHHYTVLLPAALFLPLWLWRHGHVRIAKAMAIVPASCTVLHYVAVDYAGRVGMLGIVTTLWFIGGCLVLLAVRESPCKKPPLRAMKSRERRHTHRRIVTRPPLPWMRSQSGAGA